MTRTATEKEIEDSILQYLEIESSILGFYFWKQHTVGVFDPKKRIYRKPNNRFVINGVSDILICFHGLMICCECKNKVGKLRESQKQFRDNIIKAGGIYRIVRSVEDQRRVLQEAQRIVQRANSGATVNNT